MEDIFIGICYMFIFLMLFEVLILNMIFEVSFKDLPQFLSKIFTKK